MPHHPWDSNEDGLWCPSCGEHIAAARDLDDDYRAPDQCRTCGFPDDHEKMTEYFCGEDV